MACTFEVFGALQDSGGSSLCISTRNILSCLPVLGMIKSETHPGRSGRPAACMQRELGCCGGAFSKQTSAVAATCSCERPPLLKVGCHLIIGHHAEQPSVPILLLLVAAYEPPKALSHDALFSTTIRTTSTFRQHETASEASKNLLFHSPSTIDGQQHKLDVTPNGSSPHVSPKSPIIHWQKCK